MTWTKKWTGCVVFWGWESYCLLYKLRSHCCKCCNFKMRTCDVCIIRLLNLSTLRHEHFSFISENLIINGILVCHELTCTLPKSRMTININAVSQNPRKNISFHKNIKRHFCFWWCYKIFLDQVSGLEYFSEYWSNDAEHPFLASQITFSFI